MKTREKQDKKAAKKRIPSQFPEDRSSGHRGRGGGHGVPGRNAPVGGGPDQVEDADLLGRGDSRLHEVPGFRQEGVRDDRGTVVDRMPARRRHRRDLRDVRRRQGRRFRCLPQLRRLLVRQDPRGHLPLLLPLRHGPSRPVGHLVSGPRAARRSPARPTASTT